MRAAVVYESMQGHGREVAHAIGERLAEHGEVVIAEVARGRADEAPGRVLVPEYR